VVVVHSSDSDCGRFPGLRWHNPLPQGSPQRPADRPQIPIDYQVTDQVGDALDMALVIEVQQVVAVESAASGCTHR
jgi:hypothetical protein